jgi:hypothetical protein
MTARRLRSPALRGRKNTKLLVAAAAALFAIALAGLLLANVYVSRGYFADLKQTSALKHRFALLSQRHTNRCSLARVNASITTRGRLQGSCCSPMDLDRYVEQVVGLRSYARISEIPDDPYDVSVGLARRLTAFDRSISLSPREQRIYDRAVEFSDEHGPCCCHCWRWQAFEGLGRKLVARGKWGAQRLASLWDLEDGCGGKGNRT